jgi:hypothetical protein
MCKCTIDGGCAAARLRIIEFLDYSSSRIHDAGKHNVLETGSVFILRRGEGGTYSVGCHRKS